MMPTGQAQTHALHSANGGGEAEQIADDLSPEDRVAAYEQCCVKKCCKDSLGFHSHHLSPFGSAAENRVSTSERISPLTALVF